MATVSIHQTNDTQYFGSTHYLMEERADGTWLWTLTGIVTVPFPIDPGQHWRTDKIQVALIVPGTGERYVRLSQWAPAAAGVGGAAIRGFRILEPEIAHPGVTLECDCTVEAGSAVGVGSTVEVRQAHAALSYVVHLMGTLVDPPIVR